jgi:hypothetical protein|nr:MAG TPA: putative XkdM-like protein [Caudoviricetes sp.]
MANINIRSSECAWKHGELILLGRRINGLRGFELKKTVEKEHLYGTGQNPLDIQEGNIKCEGSIKVLGFELDAMNRAAMMAGYSDITEVPHEAIVMTVKLQKTAAEQKTVFNVRGIAFTEAVNSMEQNAKMREVTLPFLAMDIIQM